ncbi:hypothetical protein WEH80_37130 [Actinomycetes bacterium KLBMP 9759]
MVADDPAHELQQLRAAVAQALGLESKTRLGGVPPSDKELVAEIHRLRQLGESTRHAVTLIVDAPEHVPAYEAQFEPEGGIVEMRPGNRITVWMTGPTPAELIVYPYPGGLSVWRDLNATEVIVTDAAGEELEYLY